MLEQKLYPPIANWLERFLDRHYRNAKNVIVEDTSRLTVAAFLAKHDLLRWRPEGRIFDIKVDITGAVLLPLRRQLIVKLAIVEVKVGAINVRSFSQVLGYAKVVHPSHAFIISPKGWSSSLHQLVRDFNRVDVLEYAPGKHIIVAKWDSASASIRPGEVLAYGQTIDRIIKIAQSGG
ncbi:MAG: hypothetical protein QXX19_08530 [Candidatus Caldarchaeum sp.]